MDVREMDEPFDVTDELDEFEPLRPPRVSDFSRNCCVFVVATIGFMGEVPVG